MPDLPYGQIKDEVKNLPIAVFNKLEREWPAHWPSEEGPRDLLAGLVKSSRFTFRASLYLVADDPAPARTPEFAVALPPLARTLLDNLSTLIFLFDDFAENARWYFRSGWRELAESVQRYEDLYPDDEVWTNWLAKMKPGLEKMRTQFGIQTTEAADAKNALPFWPIPSQMPSARKLGDDRRQFLKFLLDAHYRHLSQDAHLSWPGFLRRAGPLLQSDGDALRHLKQDSFLVSLTLLMAILTEIDAEAKFGLNARLAFIWGLLTRYHVFAEGLYERRYQALVTAS